MKTLLTNKIQTKSFLRSLSLIYVLGILIFFQNEAFSQVDCNITMSCNDLVQVSLDENCEAVIAPDMILESPDYDDSEYSVVVMDDEGNVVPNATMGSTHIGQTFQVSVTLDDCSLSCWGNITIEDKLEPVVVDCDEVIVDCDDSTEPVTGVARPIVQDACTPITYGYSELPQNMPCSSPYAKLITRSWVFTDDYGNYTTCDQLIYVTRAVIDDVTFPPNYDDIEEDAFRCDVNLDLLENGAPSPEETGYPTGIDCPNLMTYYNDITFDLCGAGFKVLRTWNVLDWCSGEERIDMQIIKIIDDAPPVCTSVPDFFNNVPTDEHECTGTFLVPPPTVVFECSDWTYTVGYKLRDENGDPFDTPIYDNVTGNATIGYTIHDLPQDTSWIVYTVTDDCGNRTQCFTEVFVTDEEAPSAVCEGFTVVSLDQIGWADVFATSFDDHSTDNCGVDSFAVKRLSTNCGFTSDLTFGDKVNFCCDDVSEDENFYIDVVMRVFDASGNYNDCHVKIKVLDKVDPEITCPADAYLDCGDDYTDITLTGGSATATDNCSVTVTSQLSGSLGNCGEGTFTRRWTATDKQGRTDQCTQRIFVRDTNPFDENDINWPGDRTITGCNPADAHPDLINGYPSYTNDDCADIAISYSDQVLYGISDACIKILRTWKVADWCSFVDESDFYTHVQVIKLENSVRPTITSSCSNVTIQSNDGSCEGDVDLTVTATDDCTDALALRYAWSVDADNNGTIDYSGTGSNVSGTYPAGSHRVTFTVTDECGNEGVCSYIFTIRDNKPPTPICLGEVIWVLDEDGNAEIWASDFNLKSEDTCDPEDDLRFSFNASGTQTALSFDCSDVPNGIEAEIPLQMYVIDTDGNSEFCNVLLVLQDSESTNACDDQNSSGRIAGKLVTADTETIQNVDVELMNMDTEEAMMEQSNAAGAYAFDNVDFYGQYVVTPINDNDPLNGVSTLDIVLIQRHILDLQSLDSPYKVLAADINNSGSLSASDLVELRKLILGINADFVENDSWIFVPRHYEFEDPMNPYSVSKNYYINEFLSDDMDVDFVGIKIGDVNSSVEVSLNSKVSSENRSISSIYCENITLRKGEKSLIPVYADFDMNIFGLQFSLSSTNFDIIGLKEGRVNVSEDKYFISEEGITASLDIAKGVDIDRNDVLFYLEVVSENSVDINDIAITNTLEAELYTDTGVDRIALDVRNRDTIVETEEKGDFLFQNVPNPFTDRTTARFTLSRDGDVELAIYDISGKQVYFVENYYVKGSHTIEISKEMMNSKTGIYYLQLRSGQKTSVKKMIMIE